MAFDITSLTDEDLDALQDGAILAEKNRRWNIANFPVSKARLENGWTETAPDGTVTYQSGGISDFPKSALAVTIQEDNVDGGYVQVDLSGLPQAILYPFALNAGKEGMLFKENDPTIARSTPRGFVEKWLPMLEAML